MSNSAEIQRPARLLRSVAAHSSSVSGDGSPCAVEALHARWLFRTQGREVLVPPSRIVVGRGPFSDLHLADDSVSRRHALVQWQSGDGQQGTVEDLSSRNGTFVNGQRIAGRAVITEGDALGFGNCVVELVRAPLNAPFDERETRKSTRVPQCADSRQGPLGELSPRELQLFTLLVRGLSQRELAERLGVSIKTVQTHRTRIGQKLGARSRAELVGVALEAGVLKPSQSPL